MYIFVVSFLSCCSFLVDNVLFYSELSVWTQVEHVVVMLAALRATQACCVAAGFVKYTASQQVACELVYGAMAALVGLLTDDTQPALVRAEAAHALGCVALGQ